MKAFRLLMLIFAAILSTIDINAQRTPLLNSYPLAPATVYLDFDGQYVAGTIWNHNGPIDATPANLSVNDITEIFKRIAEDYHPFNINITTDSAVYNKAPVLQRIRIIFTSTSDWYNNSAGVSCVGSFTWGDDTPGWVFSNLLGNNPKFVAACASHEIGHTLGLQHQSLYTRGGRKITEYNGGSSMSESGWAPIMGVGYYKNCTIWQAGTSTAGCDSIQSDLEVIAGDRNHFGFRPDDYGDNHPKAGSINIFGQNFSIKGMINHAHDKDAFRINFKSENELRLSFVPNSIIQNETNIKISLLNANADTIARYEKPKLLYEGIDIMLDSGTYYFIIEEKGNDSSSNYVAPRFYAFSGLLIPAGDFKQLALQRAAQINPFLVIQAIDDNRKLPLDASCSEHMFRTSINLQENIIKQ